MMGITSSCSVDNTCCDTNNLDASARARRRESKSNKTDNNDNSKTDDDKCTATTPAIFIDPQLISYHTCQLLVLEIDKDATNSIIEIFDHTNYLNYYRSNNMLFEFHHILSKQDVLTLNNKFIYIISHWTRHHHCSWSTDLTRLIVTQFLDVFIEADNTSYNSYTQFTIHNLQPSHTYTIRLKTINELKNVTSDYCFLSFCTLTFDLKEWEDKLFEIALCVSNIESETLMKMWNHFDTACCNKLDTNKYLWRYLYCFIAYYIRSQDRRGRIPKAKLLKPLLDDISYGIKMNMPENQQINMTKNHFVNNIIKYFTTFAQHH